ncbi:unnamed protein product [Medioppia subpectinata]|uniref:proline--tRNA ligase n=1 Tax=Medioppia subpectinata TaxID=1979941 RepID=A0A7R9L0G8_9ACAR|nr:unnamed protein product [Medioppia subpectinata]CAG2112859.1 unnamed protein product [Medioppia subpectinata]
MHSIGAQKIAMPSLVSKELWDKSGRWSDSAEELFRLKDRQKTDFCLAPTHEEVVTNLIATAKHLTEIHLPIYLYQITSKFRDEMKAKHGLLRGREFVMKDLYTFDANESQAIKTYEKVCNSYENIFKRLDLPVIKARASVGSIGGKYSDEFVLPSDLGEDEIYKCNACQTAFNTELVLNGSDAECISCKSNDLTKMNAIEVGHAFLLGNRYSAKFDAKYSSNDTNAKNIYEMGCYGLGVSRILAAAVEVLSQNHTICWPKALAPFKLCVVLPKRGSKEDTGNGTVFGQQFANCLSNVLNEDILIDDRTTQTIGRRLTGLQTLGIPYTIIAGKQITDEIPKFEIIDNQSKQNYFMTQLECIQFLENLL